MTTLDNSNDNLEKKPKRIRRLVPRLNLGKALGRLRVASWPIAARITATITLLVIIAIVMVVEYSSGLIRARLQ